MVKRLLIFIIIFPYLVFGAACAAAVEIAPINSIKNNNIFVESSTTKNNPYLYEPIIYQVKLFTKFDLTDTKFDPLVLKDAIIKPLGSYKIYDTKHNGLSIKVVELNYIITPLKSGNLIIPSQKIKGTLLLNEVKISKTSDAGVNSLFDNFSDDSKIVTRSEAFTVASTELALTIQPPLSIVSPWLPAASISLEGKWSDPSSTVGKPIQYSITISGSGITGNQLPRVSAENLKGLDYKVYIDKSEVKDSVDKLSIISSRNETYTIIPLKAGRITLPQIKINWWDVKNNKMATARINHGIIEVIADNVGFFSPELSDTKPLTEFKNLPDSTNDIALKSSDDSKLSYKLIIIILITLITILLIIMLRISKSYKSKSIKCQTSSKLKLGEARSPKEWRDFLQNYAHKNWQAPHNASLAIIFNSAIKLNPKIQKADYVNIIKTIEDALYSNKAVDMKKLNTECSDFLKLTRKKYVTRIGKKNPELPTLNPIGYRH